MPDNDQSQPSGDSTSQGNSSGSVQRGGTGTEKTPADSDKGNNLSDTTSASEPVTGGAAADEPDFMKTKPGNVPGIASQVRESLGEGRPKF